MNTDGVEIPGDGIDQNCYEGDRGSGCPEEFYQVWDLDAITFTVSGCSSYPGMEIGSFWPDLRDSDGELELPENTECEGNAIEWTQDWAISYNGEEMEFHAWTSGRYYTDEDLDEIYISASVYGSDVWSSEYGYCDRLEAGATIWFY